MLNGSKKGEKRVINVGSYIRNYKTNSNPLLRMENPAKNEGLPVL